MELNKGGLIEYMEANGYESFAEAVYSEGHTRYKEGRQTKTDGEVYARPWVEAKEEWLTSFKPVWTLDFLKDKRDKKEV